MGNICPKKANELSLPKNLQVIAGTTDSNAGVLATFPHKNDGITILGSTIAIKTTTSIRSSGLCKLRLLVEERLGVARVLRMRALVTLPLFAFLVGVIGASEQEPSITVKAVVVVFWSVSTCKSNVKLA